MRTKMRTKMRTRRINIRTIRNLEDRENKRYWQTGDILYHEQTENENDIEEWEWETVNDRRVFHVNIKTNFYEEINI